MRRPVDADRIQRFMRALGNEAEGETRLYFTGGATAVLLGWRTSTVDVDIKMDPESALSKIQRGHTQDLADVRQMLERGPIDRRDLLRRFEQIEPRLYRFPAIDPAAFRRAVEEFVSTD